MNEPLKTFPDRLTVELTNSCELLCKMCPRHHAPMDIGWMELDLFVKIIDEAMWFPTVIFPFWRGESLTHPDIIPMMEYADRKTNGNVIIATNGQNKNTAVAISQHVKRINVSIHNEHSVECVKAIDYHRVHNQPRVTATCVRGEKSVALFKPSLHQHCDEMRWYEEHTIKGAWGRTKDELTPADIHAYKEGQPMCDRLGTDLVIGWDGSAYRCCYTWVHNIPDVNAHNMSISQIWEHDNRIKILEEYPDTVCAVCSQWRGYGKTL